MIKCNKCKDVFNHHETLTFVVEDNKYNLVRKDGTTLYKELTEIDEDEIELGFKDGDTVDHCLICRNWEV